MASSKHQGRQSIDTMWLSLCGGHSVRAATGTAALIGSASAGAAQKATEVQRVTKL